MYGKCICHIYPVILINENAERLVISEYCLVNFKRINGLLYDIYTHCRLRLKGNVVLKYPHIWFLELRDFLAVLFTFLGELQLWFVNLQPRIKVMLLLAFLSVQANSVL